MGNVILFGIIVLVINLLLAGILSLSGLGGQWSLFLLNCLLLGVWYGIWGSKVQNVESYLIAWAIGHGIIRKAVSHYE